MQPLEPPKSIPNASGTKPTAAPKQMTPQMAATQNVARAALTPEQKAKVDKWWEQVVLICTNTNVPAAEISKVLEQCTPPGLLTLALNPRLCLTARSFILNRVFQSPELYPTFPQWPQFLSTRLIPWLESPNRFPKALIEPFRKLITPPRTVHEYFAINYFVGSLFLWNYYRTSSTNWCPELMQSLDQRKLFWPITEISESEIFTSRPGGIQKWERLCEELLDICKNLSKRVPKQDPEKIAKKIVGILNENYFAKLNQHVAYTLLQELNTQDPDRRKAIREVFYYLMTNVAFADEKCLELVKKALDEQKVSLWELLFFCNHCASSDLSSPLEEELLDTIIPLLYRSGCQRLMNIILANFPKKLVASAERLKAAGKPPYTLDYSFRIIPHTKRSDRELRQWLIAPFVKARPFEIGSILCTIGVGINEDELEAFLQNLDLETLLRIGMLAGLHTPVQQFILKRFFENPEKVTTFEQWSEFLSDKFIECLVNSQTELTEFQIQIVRKWFYPYPDLSDVLCRLHFLTCFPLLWDLVRPVEDSIVNEAFRSEGLWEVAYFWPNLCLPDGFAEEGETSEDLQVAKIVTSNIQLDPAAVFAALDEDDEQEPPAYLHNFPTLIIHQRALWLLRQKSQETHVRNYLKANIPKLVDLCEEIKGLDRANYDEIAMCYTSLFQLIVELVDDCEALVLFTPLLQQTLKHWNRFSFHVPRRHHIVFEDLPALKIEKQQMETSKETCLNAFFVNHIHLMLTAVAMLIKKGELPRAALLHVFQHFDLESAANCLCNVYLPPDLQKQVVKDLAIIRNLLKAELPRI